MRPHQPLNLVRAEYKRSHYFELVPPGMPIEAVMSNDYWVHVRKNFKLHDLIEVVAADGSYEYELRVVQLSRNDVKFRCMAKFIAETADDAMPARYNSDPRYKVHHSGFGRYQVLEMATGNVAADGLDKDGAVAEVERLEAERVAA